jgi:hypothetical protein
MRQKDVKLVHSLIGGKIKLAAIHSCMPHAAGHASDEMLLLSVVH